MSLRDALDLASRGFDVFPIVANSKIPAINDFPRQASRDPDVITKWWVDPVLKTEKPLNVGISCSRYNGAGESLFVVDIDNKGDKKGDDEILRLELEGFEFPGTYMQITPTGGRHLIYRTKIALKQGTNVLGKGIDTRGRGGYVVAKGSTIDGAAYVAVENPIAEIPQWVLERIGKATFKKTETEAAPLDLNAENANARAIFYLENEAPISIEGEGGDATAFVVAAKLKDFGVTKDKCLELLLENWNELCVPQWSVEELKAKVDSAFKYGKEKPGSIAPENDFKEIPDDDTSNYLENMNKEFALVFLDDSHTIIQETVDERGRKKIKYLSEPTFKRMFSTHTVQQGKGKALSWAETWLDWPKRREYQGLCFAPEREARFDHYNLWFGFSCKPNPKPTARQQLGLDMFLSHARENICDNDDFLFNWLMGYFAHMIQKPYERPLTTLVFRGKKGTGKNALIDRVGNLFGRRHFMTAHNSRYLTSNFNGHLESCLCLVLDEAFWSGDKAADGILKGLTTAPEVLIERKGRDPFTVDNLVRLVIIGNDDWIIPASNDERRYAVFEVGDGRIQDNSFFSEMREIIDEGGGNGALLQYLKDFDLSTVDINKAPQTKGLGDQKIESLSFLEKFWYECLCEGEIPLTEFDGKWPTDVDKADMRNAVELYYRRHHLRAAVPSAVSIGKLLKRVCPTVDTGQKRYDGARGVRVYRLPELPDARKSWDDYVGFTSDWNLDT